MGDETLLLKKDTRLVRNENLFSSTIDDELVMMDDEQGYYFGLNAIGKNIWEILETPRCYSDLLQELLALYDVDESLCQKDLEPFLLDLLKNNLISVVP